MITLRRIAATFAVAALALLAFPGAAPAVHVSEPVAPLTGVEMRLSNYGTQTPIACGSTVDFTTLRIEVLYTVADRPSEHWRARLEVSSRANPGANWYVDWQHANNPPHSKAPWPGTQASQRLIPGADYEVRLKVETDMSGQVIVETCSFDTSE